MRAAESNISASVLCPAFVNTQIAKAERNRLDEFGGAVEPTAKRLDASGPLVGGGMDPSDVAELVWQAMVNDQLYILTHPGWTDVVRGRVEAVLDGQQPVEVNFEKMLERRAQGELVQRASMMRDFGGGAADARLRQRLGKVLGVVRDEFWTFRPD